MYRGEFLQGDGGVEDAVTAAWWVTGNGVRFPRVGITVQYCMKASLSYSTVRIFCSESLPLSRPRVFTGTSRVGTTAARSNWDSRKGLGGMHRLGIPKHDLRPCRWRAWILAVSWMG